MSRRRWSADAAKLALVLIVACGDQREPRVAERTRTLETTDASPAKNTVEAPAPSASVAPPATVTPPSEPASEVPAAPATTNACIFRSRPTPPRPTASRSRFIVAKTMASWGGDTPASDEGRCYLVHAWALGEQLAVGERLSAFDKDGLLGDVVVSKVAPEQYPPARDCKNERFWRFEADFVKKPARPVIEREVVLVDSQAASANLRVRELSRENAQLLGLPTLPTHARFAYALFDGARVVGARVATSGTGPKAHSPSAFGVEVCDELFVPRAAGGWTSVRRFCSCYEDHNF